MRLYFDRNARYRGFSVSPLALIAAAVVVAGIGLAVGYDLVLLSPFIALWALVIWLGRGVARDRRARHTTKTP